LFTAVRTGVSISVSTCDIRINLPVHINSEEIMAEMLYSAIGDSYGFGNL
jgi:hypothetical protein